MKNSQTQAVPAGEEGSFLLNDFRFESGETMAQLRIGYVSYGQLNAARDNLLLVMPGTGNTRLSTVGHIGPGRAYDTDHYCVVCTDAIGGGTSSQPSDGLRGDFPRYSIRDMVRAQFALVTDGLGLGATPVAVVAGASMGAFQTLEWIVSYPDAARAAVLLVPGWKAGTLIGLTTARMFEIIMLDSRWQDGNYTEQPVAGLRTAGRHYFPWTVSDAYLNTENHEQLAAEAAASGEWFAQWDAWNLIRRYQASSAHDASAPFGGDLNQALTRIRAEVLVMPCAQDRLLGAEGARQLAAGIARAQCREIDSAKGHLAWRAIPGSPQTEFVTQKVRDFLGLPVLQKTSSQQAVPCAGEG